jgi:Arc/MetJ-type ribon-helix-helix transcriptional regulator
LIIVYMPAAMRDWLRRAAAGSTQLNVVLDAVEQAELAGELGEAVAAAQQPETGGLFERPTSTRGSRSHVQVSLSTLTSHVEVLDNLVVKHGASDRSALVRAALNHARQHGRKHS